MSERLNTEDYRQAPRGIGPFAFTWSDKPHRLVYDLCKEVTALQSRVAAAEVALEAAREYGESMVATANAERNRMADLLVTTERERGAEQERAEIWHRQMKESDRMQHKHQARVSVYRGLLAETETLIREERCAILFPEQADKIRATLEGGE